MVIDIIKQGLSDALADVGIIGWLVMGIYIALFGLSMMRNSVDGQVRRQRSTNAAAREEIRLKIDTIRLRLEEIKLAKAEAEEKARLAAEEEEEEREQRWREDLEAITEELQSEEDELNNQLTAANDEYYSAANDERY